jgi:hypothetical protein
MISLFQNYFKRNMLLMRPDSPSRKWGQTLILISCLGQILALVLCKQMRGKSFVSSLVLNSSRELKLFKLRTIKIV